MKHDVFPFPAIIGQEPLKTALILNAVNPRIGGVLIRGEKGTAKSTTVRALADLLPGTPMVTLPLNTTEDRVAGGIDFSLAVRTGARAMQQGLLARAHKGFLYVDEVNLLDDHIVDIILDAAASGTNRIEREGTSFCHEAQFILVGTMNPEEGELRPQLLDRFGLCVEVSSIHDIEKRILLMEKKKPMMPTRRGFQNNIRAMPKPFPTTSSREKNCWVRWCFPATCGPLSQICAAAVTWQGTGLIWLLNRRRLPWLHSMAIPGWAWMR